MGEAENRSQARQFFAGDVFADVDIYRVIKMFLLGKIASPIGQLSTDGVCREHPGYEASVTMRSQISDGR